MKTTLEYFGLEVVHMHTVGGSWLFKKFNDSWYYRDGREPNLGWLAFPAKDAEMEMIINHTLTVTVPTIRIKTPSPIRRDPYGEFSPDESLSFLTNSSLYRSILSFYNIKRMRT